MEIVKTESVVYEPVLVHMSWFTYDCGHAVAKNGDRHPCKKCFACDTDFSNGDDLSIVQFRRHDHDFVCKVCADDIKNKLNEEELAGDS